MRPTSIIVLLAMVAFLGNNLQAQSLDESRVKIIPTANRDELKVIYAIETTEPLKVKFLTENGVVASDKIKGSFPKGLLKRYDVSNINDHDFWVEISSPEMSLTYRIVPSANKQSFTPYLEKVTYNQVLVKANN